MAARIGSSRTTRLIGRLTVANPNAINNLRPSAADVVRLQHIHLATVFVPRGILCQAKARVSYPRARILGRCRAADCASSVGAQDVGLIQRSAIFVCCRDLFLLASRQHEPATVGGFRQGRDKASYIVAHQRHRVAVAPCVACDSQEKRRPLRAMVKSTGRAFVELSRAVNQRAV